MAEMHLEKNRNCPDEGQHDRARATAHLRVDCLSFRPGGCRPPSTSILPASVLKRGGGGAYHPQRDPWESGDETFVGPRLPVTARKLSHKERETPNSLPNWDA